MRLHLLDWGKMKNLLKMHVMDDSNVVFSHLAQTDVAAKYYI